MESRISDRLNVIYPDLDTNSEFIHSFTVLWNIFESQLDSHKWFISYRGFNALTDGDYFSSFNPSDYITFWKKLSNNNYDYLNDRLLFERNNRYPEAIPIIQDVINNNESDIKKQLFVSLCISYRIRNNLFHGTKNILAIGNQQEIFNYVNDFLLDVIEYFHKHQLPNYSAI